MEIGYRRYYETMVFMSDDSDTLYHDADVTKQVSFSSPWAIETKDSDNEANAMHEDVVNEITDMLENGFRWRVS